MAIPEAFTLGNGWYYTLSTIAQSFAGIAALLAVFIIMKFDRLDRDLEEIRKVFRAALSLDSKIKLNNPIAILTDDELIACIGQYMEYDHYYSS